MVAIGGTVIIDAHQHVWDLDRAEYSWLGPSLDPINRTIAFEELAPELEAHGITGSVLVQAEDNADDTEVMLDTARRNSSVVAVVAWAALDEPDALPERLAWLAEQPIVRGIRNLFHARDRQWAISPKVDAGLGLVAQSPFTLDFVTSDPAALAELVTIGERHPELRIVVDHLGKPPIGGTAQQRSEWRALLAAVASNPRVFAKVSGLYSSVGDMADWRVGGIQPFFDDALELFGAERLMYGGDWPISELAGGYTRTWDAITQLVQPLTDADRRCILGTTAASFYGFGDTGAAS
jgi:L-fuconolactonase